MVKKGFATPKEMTHLFPDNYTPFNIFPVFTNLDEPLKLLVNQSNLSTKQNGREVKAKID